MPPINFPTSTDAPSTTRSLEQLRDMVKFLQAEVDKQIVGSEKYKEKLKELVQVQGTLKSTEEAHAAAIKATTGETEKATKANEAATGSLTALKEAQAQARKEVESAAPGTLKYEVALRSLISTTSAVKSAEDSLRAATLASQSAWERAGASLKTFSDKARAFNEVAEFAQRAGGAVAGVTKFLTDGMVATEAHSRALEQLKGKYADVEAATNGVVSAEEAARASGRLSQAQIETTGSQLAAITQKSREFALQTGGETSQALDQLTEALIAGEADGLRKFGISVEEGSSKSEALKQALAQLEQQMSTTTPAARTAGEEIAGITQEFGRLSAGIADATAKYLGFKNGISSFREGLTCLRMKLFGDPEGEAQSAKTAADTAKTDTLNSIISGLKATGQFSGEEITTLINEGLKDSAGLDGAVNMGQMALAAAHAGDGGIGGSVARAQLGTATTDPHKYIEALVHNRQLSESETANKGKTPQQIADEQLASQLASTANVDQQTAADFIKRAGDQGASTANAAALARLGLNLDQVQGSREDLITIRTEQLRIAKEQEAIDKEAKKRAGIKDKPRGGGGRRFDPATLTETEQQISILSGELSAGGRGIEALAMGGEDAKAYILRSAELLEQAFVDANHKAVRHREESEIEFARRRIQIAQSAAEKILSDDKRAAEEAKREQEKLDREREREEQERARRQQRFSDVLAAPGSGFGADFRARLNEDLLSGRTTAESQFGQVQGLRDASANMGESAVQIALEEAKARVEVTRAYQDYQRTLRDSMDVQKQFGAAFAQLIDLNKTGTQSLAEFSAQGVGTLTGALKTHFAALITGKETVGEAIKGLVHELTLSLASEAFVRAIMETAHGIAALASIALAPTAPGHFAAAGLYTSVAALGGLAAAATAPSQSTSTAAAANTAATGSQRVPIGHGGDTGGSSGPSVFNFYYSGTVMNTTSEQREWLHGALNDMANSHGVGRAFSERVMQGN